MTLDLCTPGEPGYTLSVNRVDDSSVYNRDIALATVRGRVRGGYYRLIKITRPAPPVPTKPGERFWASVIRGHDPMEFIVTDSGTAINLKHGMTHNLDGFPYTIVPAPEPETVPVPADLIREAEWWDEGNWFVRSGGDSILGRIVQAVREREGADDE